MKFALLSAALFTCLLATSAAFADEQLVGKFVQLRGATTVKRGNSQVPATVKGGILPSDVINTGSNSRAKLLFIDDSVLTMADNSQLVIKEFIYAKGKGGTSIFNLLDGKMRSVVGKTKFEVHTPTAVAAARGTVIYFDVGVANSQKFSKIICLEGNVQIRSVLNAVAGQVTLTPGTMVIVKANEPPPQPVKAPPAELERARKATQGNGQSSGDSSAASGGSAAAENSSSTGGTAATDNSTGSSSPSSTGDSASGDSPGNKDSQKTTTKTIDPPPPPPPPPPPIFSPPPMVRPSKVNITIGIPGSSTGATGLTGSSGGSGL